MKRLAAIVALATIFSVSGTAFADAIDVDALYNNGSSTNTNAAEVSATSYSTVLITKDAAPNAGEVVYVNQADGSFTDGQLFLLKSGAEPGWYTVKVGNSSGDMGETKLYVYGVTQQSGDLPMTRLPGEETSTKGGKNIGYYTTISATDYNNTYNSVKVGFTDGSTTNYGGFALRDGAYTTLSGEANVRLLFQLNNVNTEYADSIGVFLSPQTVGSTPVLGGE